VAVTSGIADDDDQVGGGDGGVTGVDAFLVDGQDGIGRELLYVSDKQVRSGDARSRSTGVTH